uniref:Uncharacterized protein n=1 Tax=Panagrolaimus superbus TaxID=310955 RepID=A0A914XUB1_9BILA
MDIVAEKADKDSEDALAMIQQLPNVLNAIDKAVEKGYITFCKDSSNSSQEEEEEPPTKAEKRIYDKVMYAPPWISKKWEISMNTDFTIRDIGVRPYPKSWFKQESEYWTKETQVALIVHNEWQSSKIMEIAPKIYDAVASFKVIIQSNRKDATEFCQNLLKMGIKVAICSSGEECEKALQSIESGLPKTRIPFSNISNTI